MITYLTIALITVSVIALIKELFFWNKFSFRSTLWALTVIGLCMIILHQQDEIGQLGKTLEKCVDSISILTGAQRA